MKLSADQLDALTEVVNIGVGRAAASLSELTGQPIVLHVPTIRLSEPSRLGDALNCDQNPLDAPVVQDFHGQVSGRALLAFPEPSARALATALGEEDDQLDLPAILEEVGNIVLNAVLGSVANLVDDEFEYTVPHLATDQSEERTAVARLFGQDPAATALVADAHFEVADGSLNGSLLLAFTLNEMTRLLDKLIVAAEV